MQDHVFTALSRRRFLATGGALLGSSLLGAAETSRRGKTISIFHTTDLHGRILPTENYDGLGDLGGFARCATQIRRWRKELPDSLLVDIGDLYQGTPVSLQNDGKLMIGLFDALGYDAWVLGNHDLDWGRGIVEGALDLSKAPVLTANLTVDGKVPAEAGGAWKKVRPWMVREVGGFRIGLIGLITPGLPNWLTPGTLGGVAAVDPIESLKKCLTEIQAEKPDAIVVLGHMGWRLQDDFANPVREILAETQGVDVYLAGHSHQDQPSWMNGRVLCSQASYYGIHCGRIDLTFDMESRRLLEKRAFTVLMDSRFELDPEVMELSKAEFAKAEAEMKRKVCTVATPVEGGARGSRTSQLFCEAFADALRKAGAPVDGVFHGVFVKDGIPAGELTVEDCWKLLPYENGLLVADLTAADLWDILSEDDKQRTLWPFETAADGTGLLFQGKPLEPDKRYRIAFNTYDGQSGGGRLLKLREILNRPESKRTETKVATRAALIDFLSERKVLE
ncbi:bifunctional metallophosphatase/5'-nucleotidase [Luteolibacter arcticus]|uniref:Bifunctional metallophosphatase/5'-nucleotidase n=1 Tax=Luteolibacter arcticus TaxID=1581411 RepID=A0ABT3GFL5_9BACT|nr:bifunctional UDP-sugar hydrolase/5'-nucleotidase [Luteolibacter arcticus]MCW1922395.1 bifunctional metallophosphatase/5'-nucleotidase [Luteolibacter arcticus]